MCVYMYCKSPLKTNEKKNNNNSWKIYFLRATPFNESLSFIICCINKYSEFMYIVSGTVYVLLFRQFFYNFFAFFAIFFRLSFKLYGVWKPRIGTFYSNLDKRINLCSLLVCLDGSTEYLAHFERICMIMEMDGMSITWTVLKIMQIDGMTTIEMHVETTIIVDRLN